jgi:hypothetical protein
MSQSQHQIDTGRIDTDDHSAGEPTDLTTDDPVTTAGGAHYTCRTHDDPNRARSRGLTAGPVVRTSDE